MWSTSGCGPTGPRAHVPLVVRDESPVVIAAWRGTKAEGPPAAFAAYDPTSPEVVFELDRTNATHLTLVAVDAATLRSAPMTVAAAAVAQPVVAATASSPSSPSARRGCGKSN